MFYEELITQEIIYTELETYHKINAPKVYILQLHLIPLFLFLSSSLVVITMHLANHLTASQSACW